jgi:hypothetical protein
VKLQNFIGITLTQVTMVKEIRDVASSQCFGKIDKISEAAGP